MRSPAPRAAHRTQRRTLISLIALMVAAMPAWAAEPKPVIGRIFFSPAERHHRGSAGVEAPSKPRPRLVINGALRSSDRWRAVWVNGAVVKDSVNASARTDAEGNVWLTSGEHGTRRLKPGQSVAADGSIADLLPAGSLRRQ